MVSKMYGTSAGVLYILGLEMDRVLRTEMEGGVYTEARDGLWYFD